MPVEGHWFGNDRLDFRPENYWTPGTKVTVTLNLDGVEGRPGVYGKQTKTMQFTIGRSQVSTVDASAHTMKVVRDGKAAQDHPDHRGQPRHNTWNGQMVISEKFAVTRMNSETVGFGGEYDIKDVPHAMRLTSSGTFIHGNYWAPPASSARPTPATAASACGTRAAAATRAARRPGSTTTPSSATWSS